MVNHLYMNCVALGLIHFIYKIEKNGKEILMIEFALEFISYLVFKYFLMEKLSSSVIKH